MSRYEHFTDATERQIREYLRGLMAKLNLSPAMVRDAAKSLEQEADMLAQYQEEIARRTKVLK